VFSVLRSSSRSSLREVGPEDHVLEHGPETAGGGVDLGLVLGREPDDLGVAAALEVEDALVGPAVLVVADEPAVGIRRQRGLAGARQAEEQGNVAIVADVGRAVHGQHPLQGQQEVHHREDALLDLAAVGRVADEHQPLGEVDDDGGVGAGAVDPRIGLERRRRDDRELRARGSGSRPGCREG
jgi:hypothetical protein